MRLRPATILPLALFVVMGGVLVIGLKHDPRVMPSTLLGAPLPAFDLPALDEAQPNIKSSSMKGGFTLLNVWGSWCVSCREEHPLLMSLSKDKRFKLIGIDWRDSKANAEQFLSTNGNPYAAIGTDQTGRTVIDLGVSGAPETFVVDSAGIVRLRVPGPLSPEIWAKDIEPLLKDQGASFMIRIVFAIMLMLFCVEAAHAVLPSEMLANPQQEARARSISSNLRCLVCQNQTIDDSNADLARDLRLIVRERIVAGDSDAQVMDYVVARYGNYVLLKPPFQMDTVLLWLLPFAALILALAMAYATLRGRPVTDEGEDPNDILKGE